MYLENTTKSMDKGKQVRDNIHAIDVARFIFQFFMSPKYGEVYNIGGGYENSVSLIEAIKKIEEILIKQSFEILDKNRIGDNVITQTLLKPSLIIRIGRQKYR